MRLVSYCDFETTVNTEKTEVWLWCALKGQDYKIGYDIESFIEYLKSECYTEHKFFNLGFDGVFIIDHLLKNGFEFVCDMAPTPKTFSAIVTDAGVFHEISINFNGKLCVIRDSMLLLGGSVRSWGEKLGHLKGETPLLSEKPKEILQEWIDYIKDDVSIVKEAEEKIRNTYRIKSMTRAGAAYSSFKELTPDFNILFPDLDFNLDSILRDGYLGGYCGANPLYINKLLNMLLWCYDFKSSYSSRMMYSKLPYGLPRVIKGFKAASDNTLCVYKGEIKYCVKKGCVSMLLHKNHAESYLSKYNGPITITSVDLDILKETCDYEFDCEYTYEFDAKIGIFDGYINYWFAQKEAAEKDGDMVLRTFSKDMLNSLYGKFGSKISRTNKAPVLKDGKVSYIYVRGKDAESKYLPMAMFITAWGRYELFKKIKAVGFDKWVYSDTDSWFILEPIEEKEGLGGHSLEFVANKWKVLGRKMYMLENENGDLKKAFVGLGRRYHDQVTFENFESGSKFSVQSMSNTVGGRAMFDREFVLGDRVSQDIDIYINGGDIPNEKTSNYTVDVYEYYNKERKGVVVAGEWKDGGFNAKIIYLDDNSIKHCVQKTLTEGDIFDDFIGKEIDFRLDFNFKRSVRIKKK